MRRRHRPIHLRMLLPVISFLILVLLIRNALLVVKSSPSVASFAENLEGFVTTKLDLGKATSESKYLNSTHIPRPELQKTAPVDIRSNGSDSLTESKSLPSFENGGLIFYLHIPKTGGTTIRRNLDKMKGINYRFVSGAELYDKSLPFVWQYITTTVKRKRKRDIVFLEVHGRDSPHLLQLRDILLLWKRMATKHKVPTFFFSVVREPLAYALSYFKFFHVHISNRNFKQVEPTESNLLRWSLHNPQCQFLARGEYSLREEIKQQPTPEECEKVHNVFLETMDWIGTTERMNVETLSILKRILKLDDFDFPPQRVSMEDTNASLSFQHLNQSTLSTLENLSTLDADLYHNLQKEYPFSVWKDFAFSSSN